MLRLQLEVDTASEKMFLKMIMLYVENLITQVGGFT